MYPLWWSWIFLQPVLQVYPQVFNGVEVKRLCYNFLTSFPFFPFLFLIRRSTFLISTGGIPFLYLSFHQNSLIHMPSFFHLLHSLMHSSIALHNLMHFSIASKAVHSFTIRYLQVGYQYSSLDLNIL